MLAPRRLRPEERHELYFGINERNQVILIEPRDPRFDILGNRDLLKWGQRVLAAEELIATPDTPRKADYERIAREDRKAILDALRRGGLISTTTSTGQNWIVASSNGTTVNVTANSASLATGVYTGTVTACRELPRFR